MQAPLTPESYTNREVWYKGLPQIDTTKEPLSHTHLHQGHFGFME